MATPFPRTMPQVIKIEDEGNHTPPGHASAEQELMNRFRNNVPPPPIAEVFIAHQRVELSAPLATMVSPFPGTPVIKVEDEENSGVSDLVLSDQELRNKFWEDVKRRIKLRKRGMCASGRAQPPPPPPQPVQPPPPPSPLPLPTPPPPVHHQWAKRPATAPPPGFAGVRQPPLKQYQRRPPGQRAPAQPHPPAPTSAPRAPCPPPANVQRARHAPVPPPAHAGPQALQRKPKPSPKHPTAKKKKPTARCAFCGVLCMTAWHLEQHEKGRKHRNKVACLAGEMNVTCPVCDVYLSGALNVEQHYAGKHHIWRLKLSGGA